MFKRSFVNTFKLQRAYRHNEWLFIWLVVVRSNFKMNSEYKMNFTRVCTVLIDFVKPLLFYCDKTQIGIR